VSRLQLSYTLRKIGDRDWVQLFSRGKAFLAEMAILGMWLEKMAFPALSACIHLGARPDR